MERGQYGGTPTLMNTLSVGTKFYVCNGAWNGTITEKDGIKHVKVDAFEDREIPLTGDNENYMLDINIEEKGEENVTEETVTISKEEYEGLMEDVAFLRCLEAAGVDNWEGYGFAWDMMESEE